MRERGICCNDLDQTLVEQLDVGGEPADTAARKTPQQRVFQQSRGILSGDFLGTELAANSEHLGQQFGCRRRPLRWTCQRRAARSFRADVRRFSYLIKIGRTHVSTPVTRSARMPSS